MLFFCKNILLRFWNLFRPAFFASLNHTRCFSFSRFIVLVFLFLFPSHNILEIASKMHWKDTT